MDDVIEWLLDGDVAVQYQTHRDLLDDDRPELAARIGEEGYAAALLGARGPDGHWGRGFYQPKWTSSHYTLLELRNLGLPRENPVARAVVARILAEHLLPDGGLAATGRGVTDVCINGMALHFACWFGGDPDALASMVDWLLERRFADGGFNCHVQGRAHSSHHTTTSVLEGLTTYLDAGHRHRVDEVAVAIAGCVDYLLEHRLFRSHSTGEVIHREFLKSHHPPRWHFDVLRGLDALAAAGVDADHRMDDALDVLAQGRRADGRWVAARAWPGETHLQRDQGDPHRWVTLQARRVLRRYRGE